MKVPQRQRHLFLLVLAGIIVVSAGLVYFFSVGTSFLQSDAQSRASGGSAGAQMRAAASPGLVPTSAPQPVCTLKGRAFQMGVAFPQWGTDAYGETDSKWQAELPEMRSQTASCWVEMPVLFYQTSLTSTTVTRGPSTSSIAAFTSGIRLAHRLGLHVFVTPLLQAGGAQPWAGAIQFSSYAQEQQWFESYWQAVEPYLTVAAQEHVEQFAIGTEYEWLQEYAPDSLWNTLIARFQGVFSGSLTYDMNWSSLQAPVRAWMHNPALKAIGISAYLPLIETRRRVEPTQVAALWQQTVKVALDSFATRLGEPIFISEIGYRNSSDALYHSWESTSTAPSDPEEQTAAYDAALANVLPDTNIAGIFFWGWDDAGAFNLRGLPVVQTIQHYYRPLQV